MEVNILCSPPFSIKKVATHIYEVLWRHVKAHLWLGHFHPEKLRGSCIIIGNPHSWERRIYLALRRNPHIDNFIFYVTLEGNIRPNWLPNTRFLEDGIIVTPSNYVRKKLEQFGFRVEKIIPHRIEAYGHFKSENRKVLGYMAGYLKRKYPHYLFPHLKAFRNIFYVITTKNNPCLLYTSPSPRDLSTSRMPSSA